MKQPSPCAEDEFIGRRVKRAAADSAIRRLHRMIAEERGAQRSARRFGVAAFLVAMLCVVAVFIYYLASR